uniref:Secreted protein n=1 Tax=Heterorhabditis bacteriophora TaxID=37862 RepID=A0A1I7X3W7_HETBA
MSGVLILVSSTVLFATVSCLTCTYCPYNLLPHQPTNCTENCQGDVCYIAFLMSMLKYLYIYIKPTKKNDNCITRE